MVPYRDKQGRAYTNFYLKYYETKYIAKYIRKRAKEGLGFQFYADEVKSVSSSLADFLLHSEDAPERDAVTQELKRILTELDAARAGLDELGGCCLRCSRGLGEVLEFQERSVHHGKRLDTHNFADLISDAMESADIEDANLADLIPTLQAVASYSISIHKTCVKNVGLDHGKVREVRCYMRSPRFICCCWGVPTTRYSYRARSSRLAAGAHLRKGPVADALHEFPNSAIRPLVMLLVSICLKTQSTLLSSNPSSPAMSPLTNSTGSTGGLGWR